MTGTVTFQLLVTSEKRDSKVERRKRTIACYFNQNMEEDSKLV